MLVCKAKHRINNTDFMHFPVEISYGLPIPMAVLKRSDSLLFPTETRYRSEEANKRP